MYLVLKSAVVCAYGRRKGANLADASLTPFKELKKASLSNTSHDSLIGECIAHTLYPYIPLGVCYELISMHSIDISPPPSHAVKKSLSTVLCCLHCLSFPVLLRLFTVSHMWPQYRHFSCLLPSTRSGPWTKTADSQRHRLDVLYKMARQNSTAACVNSNKTLRSVVKALSAFHANSPSRSLGSQVSMPILIQVIVFAYQIGT